MQSRLKQLGDVLLRKSNAQLLPTQHQCLLPSLTRLLLLSRSLSTDAAPPSDAPAEPSSDPFLRLSSTGLVYGKLNGTGKFTLKTDIVHFFEGCGLSIEDVKVDYNRIYTPFGMILQFSSHSKFDSAMRLINRKGRLYRLEKVDRGQWDILKSYDGKVVLLQGLSRATTQDDVERFLSSCDYDASQVQIFLRPAKPEPIKLALVHFPSRLEAMNAYRRKNRGFCANTSVNLRILQ